MSRIQSRTDSARLSESIWLDLSSPVLSVWPATTINQPGFALMPTSEFTSSLSSRAWRPAGIEQRRAVEAEDDFSAVFLQQASVAEAAGHRNEWRQHRHALVLPVFRPSPFQRFTVARPTDPAAAHPRAGSTLLAFGSVIHRNLRVMLNIKPHPLQQLAVCSTRWRTVRGRRQRVSEDREYPPRTVLLRKRRHAAPSDAQR